MKQGRLIWIPLVLSLLVTTCLSLENKNNDVVASPLRAGSRTMQQQNNCRSVRDIICSSPDSNTFCEMVTKASNTYNEFGEGLDGDRPYTVFAPTDDAFERYEGELLSLKENELYRTLLFHFYEDVALKDDDLGCSGKLVSLTGDMSRTKCKRITAGVYTKHQRGRGNKAIGDFPEIYLNASTDACAGVVHKISHVLLPIAFKPFQPYVLEVDDEEEVVVPEEDSEDEVVAAVEEEEQEAAVEVVVADPVEEENAVVEDTASSLCFFNCPPKEAPTAAPVASSLCLFNCDIAPTPAPAPALCFFNCPPEEEPAAAEVETPAPEPVEAEVEEEEAPQIKPPLKANGVFLIILGTLLLCFIFFCLR